MSSLVKTCINGAGVATLRPTGMAASDEVARPAFRQRGGR